MLFSIVMVTYNAGAKVETTMESIFAQSERDYEIVIKDAMSADDTLSRIPRRNCVKVCSKKDIGIYDGMNQAIDLCEGNYIIFMNAGDRFNDSEVLARIKKYIMKDTSHNSIFYGDYVSEGEVKIQAYSLTGFALFRKPLCHQSIIYNRDVLADYGNYDINYKICADHELTMRLWNAGVDFKHIPVYVAEYEGKGISESPEGYRIAKREKKNIDKRYFGGYKYFVYKIVYLCTCPGIRRLMFSKNSPGWIRKIYYSLKNMIDKR